MYRKVFIDKYSKVLARIRKFKTIIEWVNVK